MEIFSAYTCIHTQEKYSKCPGNFRCSLVIFEWSICWNEVALPLEYSSSSDCWLVCQMWLPNYLVGSLEHDGAKVSPWQQHKITQKRKVFLTKEQKVWHVMIGSYNYENHKHLCIFCGWKTACLLATQHSSNWGFDGPIAEILQNTQLRIASFERRRMGSGTTKNHTS